MKNFFESLREHGMKIIKFKNKKFKLLTKEQQESYENARICYVCKEKFKNKYLTEKKYRKFGDHYYHIGEYRGAVHSICNLKHSAPKKISRVFHNGFNYHKTIIYHKTASRRI